MNLVAYINGYIQKQASEAGVFVADPIILKDPTHQKRLKQALKILNESAKNLTENRTDIPGAATRNLPRVSIPSEKLSPELLKMLGFKSSLIAVPERGQAQWTTYRHPERYHIHRHKNAWYMHQDKHIPMQNAISKIRNRLLRDQIDLLFSGVAHLTTEGIPGAAAYVRDIAEKAPDYEEIVKMGPKKYELTKELKDIL